MISRIAIFRALNLGDMLCIIPTVRAIRAAWPGADIHLIGLPWQKDFVRRFKHYFDHFIEFPGWPGLPEQEPDLERIPTFLRDVRNMRYDLLFQMQGNGEITNTLCATWGSQRMCGLRKPGEYAPDENMFPVSTDDEHEVIRFFKLLKCLDIPPRGTSLEFPIDESEESSARARLKSLKLEPHRFVCIHPGARDIRRRWPVDNFAFIANKLAHAPYPIVLTGSAQEAAILSSLQEKIDRPVINIVETFGHLSIGELAGMLKYARLLISNDTGVSHVASALKLPSVVIFSPYSNPHRWRPLDTQRHIIVSAEASRQPQFVLTQIEKAVRQTRLQPTGCLHELP